MSTGNVDNYVENPCPAAENPRQCTARLGLHKNSAGKSPLFSMSCTIFKVK
jgi:hypothetical protein